MAYQSPRPRVIALALLLSGCSGAAISTVHFEEGLGQAPPVPVSGGAGPVETAIDPAVDDLTLPSRLPDLLVAYRGALVQQAHMLPHDQAEAFADAEIAALETAYEGREEALTAELRRRLTPGANAPGDPDAVDQPGPVFPPEPVVLVGSETGDQK